MKHMLDDMTSKRNSRVFVDEVKHRDDPQQKPAAAAFRSRRNSRSSSKDDAFQAANDMEEAKRGASAVREPSTSSRSEKSVASSKDVAVCGTRGAVEQTMASVASITYPTEFPPAPINGRPENFGVVVPGVYRSSYPKSEEYGFLQGLKLKTVVTLVKKDELDDGLKMFVTNNRIHQIVFNMKGTKKEAIPANTMKSILSLVLDRRNYPLLIHCNHGKHRTGCVVAAIRKLSGWELNSAVDEYKSFAEPKVRECDVDYIRTFQPAPLQAIHDRARFSPVQLRTFFRALLFSTFVMVLWLVSGTQIVSPEAFTD